MSRRVHQIVSSASTVTPARRALAVQASCVCFRASPLNILRWQPLSRYRPRDRLHSAPTTAPSRARSTSGKPELDRWTAGNSTARSREQSALLMIASRHDRGMRRSSPYVLTQPPVHCRSRARRVNSTSAQLTGMDWPTTQLDPLPNNTSGDGIGQLPVSSATAVHPESVKDTSDRPRSSARAARRRGTVFKSLAV